MKLTMGGAALKPHIRTEVRLVVRVFARHEPEAPARSRVAGADQEEPDGEGGAALNVDAARRLA
jgi:hypothetical protein